MAGENMRLVPATAELVELDLAGAELLADRLEVDLPADWPPEFHGERVLRHTLDRLLEPGSAGWWLHYFVSIDGDRPELIGTGGLKGPPVDGLVEIGYSVVPSAQRRGYATEACAGLIASARERGAKVVRAETLPERIASGGCLRSSASTRLPRRRPA